jgi:hypothetical protein
VLVKVAFSCKRCDDYPLKCYSMDNCTVDCSVKLPSEGLNVSCKKKLFLSWWRQQKKTQVPEVSKYNSSLDASVCSNESTWGLESAGETQRPSSCDNLHNNNRNKDLSSSYNKIDSDTESDLCTLIQSKNWLAVQVAVNLEPDLAFSWISRVDECGKVIKCLLIHAAVSLKAPPIVIEELLSLHPGCLLSSDNNGGVPFHLAVLYEATFEVMLLFAVVLINLHIVLLQ